MLFQVTIPFKDAKDVFIVGGVDEITAALDDSLVTVNTILGSRYCSNIRLEVSKYQRDLVLIQETIEEVRKPLLCIQSACVMSAWYNCARLNCTVSPYGGGGGGHIRARWKTGKF